MSAYLAQLIHLYIFPTGRRLFAHSQSKTLAAAAGHTALEAHCTAALAHDQQTQSLEAQWSGNKGPRRYAPEAKKTDVLIDICLGALDDALDAEIRDATPGDMLGQAAVQLRHELFPQGVGAVTGAVYVNELAEAERIVGLLQSAKWSPTVKDLGLSRRVDKLVGLTQQYRSALGLTVKPVTYEQVKEARDKGQELLLQTAAMIMGLHPSDSGADVAGRTSLMGPILAQNEAIGLYLRARRAVPEVNPETGEALPEGEGG